MSPQPGPGDPPAPAEPSDAAPQSPVCIQEADEGVDAQDDVADVTDAPRTCCEGLTRVPVYKSSIIRLDECQLAGGGRFSCVQCGNGRCGKGENVCNCPADCH